MVEPGTSEYIIQEVVGCGPFQFLLTVLVYFLGNACTVYTTMFMSFGNYDPGWKCLNVSEFSIDTNDTTLGGNESGPGDYKISEQHCLYFESCKQVVFNSDSSTIVSEWSLVCDSKWIPSIIISVQMAGLAIGCPIAGHLGDAVGRKRTLYSALFAMAVMNGVSIFSVSWQMFAVLRFFLGMSAGFVVSLYFVLTAEFATMKWRSPLASLPAWNVSDITFSLACMYLKNWRHVHIVTAVIGLVGFIPVFWVPESLRFMEVKNNSEQFERIAGKISRMNGKRLPSNDYTKWIPEMRRNEREFLQKTKLHGPEAQPPNETYNYYHLFRGKYTRLTAMITVPWFSANLVYYAIGFGIKALHGHFYINLMISSACEIPFLILPTILSNYFGRKIASAIFAAGAAISMIGASCFEELSSGGAENLGVLVFIFAAKISVGGFWCVMMVHTIELYPTAVRGIAYSWGNLAARIGGIIAPFLIPNNPSTVFISYAVMGVMNLICCVIIMALPETKNLPLKETYRVQEKKRPEVEAL